MTRPAHGYIRPMAGTTTTSAERLRVVADEAGGCTRCDLHERATQTVFGEGAPDAALFLIGEQPGDQEDRQGHPFVGPAGRVLDEALEAAGVDRSNVYITNAVKHFKWTARGKRRIHERPNRTEIVACRPWFDAELAIVSPRLVVVMGATAGQALWGPSFRVGASRGTERDFDGRAALATIHPSAVLRAGGDAGRRAQMDLLVEDLALAGRLVARMPGGA
ncbi:MAG TPA: UdgX family uracil-DNA binding protein [Acidimicrobiales bacterium]|nr:UdgX family uracil-DNA binding protein [Acidimicrobiales bacterium]